MRLTLALASLLVLVACGADGPPQPPAARTPGVSVTGEIGVGIVAGGGG